MKTIRTIAVAGLALAVGLALFAAPARADFYMKQKIHTGAFSVIDATRVCSITTNLGDTKTTISHPASTSHGRLTEEQRLAAGITQGLVRLAVGLENVEDLKADLHRGLAALA